MANHWLSSSTGRQQNIMNLIVVRLTSVYQACPMVVFILECLLAGSFSMNPVFLRYPKNCSILFIQHTIFTCNTTMATMISLAVNLNVYRIYKHVTPVMSVNSTYIFAVLGCYPHSNINAISIVSPIF
ncbi:Uncharacterized protein TCM_026165 [Theobroma cacao]|uniref:Uncharacterized protein n=1 Tax=Theobroma cacao TaxID=3641 RepID=A0A061F0J7_THECC|nr:Uncharacterized protein TCM_026165 [Theobroma cacao]